MICHNRYDGSEQARREIYNEYNDKHTARQQPAQSDGPPYGGAVQLHVRVDTGS